MADRDFQISKPLVKALRRYAHGTKGLDEPTYRLHLHAVGATSTLDLSRSQHEALLARLRALPDAPRKAQGRAA